MAVLDVIEQRRSSDSTSGTVVFLVVCDAHMDTREVGRDSRIPQRGTLWPGDAGLVVDNIAVAPLDDATSPTRYTATVSYTKVTKEEPATAPWDEPDQVDYGGDEGTEPYFKDKSDPAKPVVNSAGEPFDDLPEREVGSLIITVTRNSLTFNPNQAAEYISAVNKSSFRVDGNTINAKKAKMGVITAKRQYWEDEQGNLTKYYVVTYPIKLRETWEQKFEDRGRHALTDKYGSDEKTLKAIVSGEPPAPVDKPWPLNGEGEAMPNVDDEPAQLTFKPYAEKSFSVFNFR